MIKRQIQDIIMSELSAGKTVVLGGLPRVGRSTLADAIAGELDERAWSLGGQHFSDTSKTRGAKTFLTGQILIIDDVSEAHIDAVFGFLHVIRQGPPSGFGLLLLPRDAKTEQRLRDNTGGVKSFIEMVPVQTLEHLADSKDERPAVGPVDAKPTVSAVRNAKPWSLDTLWWRGGLPESLNADSDTDSFYWRRDYIASLRQGDYSIASVQPSDRFSDILLWIANIHGNEFDYSKCAGSLRIPAERVRAVVRIMVKLALVRELPNWPAGSNKSMSKYSRLYIRDSGLLHAAIGSVSAESMSDSEKGHSWEGFAIEALIQASSWRASNAFYRDKKQNEVDLVLDFRMHSGPIVAIEVKVSDTKGVRNGYAVACDAIQPDHRWLVHSGEVSDNLPGGVKRLPLVEALRTVQTF